MMKLQATVGELEIISHADKKATLSYSIPENGRISIVIQDQLGRPCFEKDFQVVKDSNQLTFSLPAMSPGEYHAWISFGDKTAIRQLRIPPSKGGFNMSKLMNLFT